jgi:hypothetical protein
MFGSPVALLCHDGTNFFICCALCCPKLEVCRIYQTGPEVALQMLVINRKHLEKDASRWDSKALTCLVLLLTWSSVRMSQQIEPGPAWDIGRQGIYKGGRMVAMCKSLSLLNLPLEPKLAPCERCWVPPLAPHCDGWGRMVVGNIRNGLKKEAVECCVWCKGCRDMISSRDCSLMQDVLQIWRLFGET